MGELALMLNSTQSQKQLRIAGELVNATGMGQIDYTPGQNLTVNAKITESGKPVDAGSFSFTLETLQGATAATPLTFRQETGNWTGTFYIGQQAGFNRR
jgi:hypothetical protein